MKHLRALHAQVNAAPSGAVSISLESEQIAMEGFVQSVKAKWEAFKKSTAPTDHQTIISKLGFIPKMKQDLLKIKRDISSTGDADIHDVTKRINKAATKLPVTATNPAQLLVEMDKLRKQIEMIGRNAQKVQDAEQLKKVRESFAALKKREGKVNPNMTWTKEQMLKFIDVLGQYFDTSLAVGKLYSDAHNRAKREEPKATMEAYTSPIAMEHLEELETIALEGFFSAIGGLALLFASIVIYVFGMILACWGIVIFIAGGFIPGFAAMVGGYMLMEGANAARNSSERMIYGDV